jgi:hypothetical protein
MDKEVGVVMVGKEEGAVAAGREADVVVRVSREADVVGKVDTGVGEEATEEEAGKVQAVVKIRT